VPRALEAAARGDVEEETLSEAERAFHATVAALVRAYGRATSSASDPPPPEPSALVRVEDFTVQVARGTIAVAEAEVVQWTVTSDGVVVDRFTEAADKRTLNRSIGEV
jgi:hypothetical protein